MIIKEWEDLHEMSQKMLLKLLKKKRVLNCCWKNENVAEVQREFRKKLQITKFAPVRLPIKPIIEKIEANATILNTHWESFMI